MKVHKWINQTASHKVADDDEVDCKFFMDFDMAVLGRPWESYVPYTKQIRTEYQHVPEAVFCKARSAFLRGASAADANVFATEEFRALFEHQARLNMRMEAEALLEEESDLRAG